MHEFILKTISLFKKHPVIGWILVVLSIYFTAGFILLALSLFGVVAAIYYLVYFIKTQQYYKSEDFIGIKKKLSDKIIEYNEFDLFMDETREFIRSQQKEISQGNLRHSTLTVYKNSQLDVYKYIIKYFFINTKIDEQTMQVIESILQKYNTIARTYEILEDESQEILSYIQNNMYRGAYIFYGLTMKKLGSRKLPKFVKDYYLWYAFDYTSPTNKKHYRNTIVLDDSRLEDFAEYLNRLIAFRKTAKYQRQLMTPQLRESILARDKYTCKNCGVTRASQSHLLLEVDHMIPIAKGGVTIESNLQALCWKCNRSKGARV